MALSAIFEKLWKFSKNFKMRLSWILSVKKTSESEEMISRPKNSIAKKFRGKGNRTQGLLKAENVEMAHFERP